MLNFFIGFAFFEFGALCGFFVAALMQAARDGGEIAGRNRTIRVLQIHSTYDQKNRFLYQSPSFQFHPGSELP